MITDFSQLPAENATYYAVYAHKPSMTYSLQNTQGLELEGNKLSGIVKTQNDDGKFYIPMELTSEKFNEYTTIKVTNPNNETQTYKYSATNGDGIMTASDEKTIKLNLEAIKSSKITGDNGKVYEIAVDVDGEDNDKYQKNYMLDYGSVETLEEIINEAAARTQDAHSLKITKNNNVKGREDSYTLEYNKDEKRK